MTAKNAIALYMRAHNARARGSDSNLILSQISWKFVTLSAFIPGLADGKFLLERSMLGEPRTRVGFVFPRMEWAG